MKVLTLITLEEANQVLETNKLDSLKVYSHIPNCVVKRILNYLNDTLGKCKGLVVGLTRLHGMEVSLSENSLDCVEYLNESKDCVAVLEKNKDKDIVTVDYIKFLSVLQKINGCDDDTLKEYYLEQVDDLLTLGSNKCDYEMCFMRNFDLNNATDVQLINSDWEMVSMKGTVEEKLKLSYMNYFNKVG